jgi:hypothetical protein
MTPNPKQQISTTYSAAADHYELPALGFWNHFGGRTVQRAGLASGAPTVRLPVTYAIARR